MDSTHPQEGKTYPCKEFEPLYIEKGLHTGFSSLNIGKSFRPFVATLPVDEK